MYKAIKGNTLTYASPERVKELYYDGYTLYDESGHELTEKEILSIKPETHTLDLREYKNEFRN